MLVSLDDLRSQMLRVLARRGIEGSDALFIANDYLEAQAEGRLTHGVGKFLLIDTALGERIGAPVVIWQNAARASMDGRKEIGQLAALRASTLAAELAESHGVGVVSLKNYSRYGRLIPYVRRIAEAGNVAIVTNNGGPPAVAPYGSRTPIMGTNPIAFGFPTSVGEPYLIDFSTAERVWGEIRQAILEGRPLPDGAFLDRAGVVTTSPPSVESVLPFGGPKGSALCIAIELMAGLLAGAAVGSSVSDEYDLGAIFIAIAALPDAAASTNPVDALLAEIRRSLARPGYDHVLAPGDGSRLRSSRTIESGVVEVDHQTLEKLVEMAQGGAGLAPDRLTN